MTYFSNLVIIIMLSFFSILSISISLGLISSLVSQGRLKLLGTLVFPKAKYATLKAGTGHVLCEDVFENMVRLIL